MSTVHIANKSKNLALKSLKNKYVVRFGEGAIDKNIKSYSDREWIEKYAENILFWESEQPTVVPNMSSFSLAKHAICANAMQQLWKVCAEKNMTEEVQIRLTSLRG